MTNEHSSAYFCKTSVSSGMTGSTVVEIVSRDGLFWMSGDGALAAPLASPLPHAAESDSPMRPLMRLRKMATVEPIRMERRRRISIQRLLKRPLLGRQKKVRVHRRHA